MQNEFQCNNCPGQINTPDEIPMGGLGFLVECTKCKGITYWRVVDTCQTCGSVNNIACCGGKGDHHIRFEQITFSPETKEVSNETNSSMPAGDSAGPIDPVVQ